MAYFLYKKIAKHHKQRASTSTHDSAHEMMGVEPQASPTRTTEQQPKKNKNSNVFSQLHTPHEKTPGQERSESTGSPEDTITAEEKKAATRYRWKLVLGLFLPFTVQALDVTIIASAIPFIASDFNQLSQLNWIVSAFNLCEAAFIPFWGQIADIFGRYAAIQGASLTTLIGAALCSGVPVTAFPMLLVGRSLQGVGCAGILICTKIILADKVSLKENARNSTTFTIVAGIGYGVGPVVGGYLTQVSWRWCFIISLPMSLIGMILTHFLLRSELVGPQEITRTDGNTTLEIPQSFKAKLSTIDFGGQFLFLFGMGLLVLSLTWAGSYYAWNDVKVLVPLILAVILIASFLTWENLLLPGKALSSRFPLQKAMLSIPLLTSRNAGLLMYINFTTGMAMYAVFYFSSLYFILVESLPAGEAGRNLIYYMPGLGVGAYTAMFACNVWPLQTWFPLFLGTMLEPLGITLLAVAMKQGNLPWVYGMLALTGVGSGIRFMPGTLHGIGYNPKSISSIVSLMALSQTLGGTISTTLMLNIFNNHLHQHHLTFSSTSSISSITALSSSQQAYFKSTTKSGIVLAFFALTAFLWLGLVAMSAMGNVRIGQGVKSGEDTNGVETGNGNESGNGRGDILTKGSFVASWFRKEKTLNGEVA